ncbi:MAG TPA: hypothetical protein VK167_02900 [Flavipsychrobacter sp.]|nr:hypothetical protein [Flavipsychrobacter sp.]
MKKLFPLIAGLILVAMIVESCGGTNKPPRSSGHGSYRASKKNR